MFLTCSFTVFKWINIELQRQDFTNGYTATIFHALKELHERRSIYTADEAQKMDSDESFESITEAYLQRFTVAQQV